MRIFIISIDDPIVTNNFIKKIIEQKAPNIVGLAITKDSKLTISKRNSKVKYIISLLLIMGLKNFFKNSFILISYKLRKKIKNIIPNYNLNNSLEQVAKLFNIRVYKINSPNDHEFLQLLKSLEIDIIINQSQSILKRELLSIPKKGVINRHNALLPKNRGRLTPFWVLYKKERETGVSIHFVTEKIDAGDIIVQKSYEITEKDNFNSLVKKNYEIAPIAMLEALEKLEKGDNNFIKNDDNLATYNSIPTLKQAWEYRKDRILRFFR